MNTINNLEEEIKTLTEELRTTKLVLAGEKGINLDLQKQIQTMQTYIDTLIEINERYAKKIGELKLNIKYLVDKK